MKSAMVVCALLAAVAPARAGVKELLDASGLGGGVACFAGLGGGEADEALGLAGAEGWLVMAVDADAARVEALRKRAAEAGALGRSLFVETSAKGELPLADCLADMVVARDGGFGLSEAEAVRVLAPGRGRALLGAKWTTRPALAGADNWTHRLRGPDNNPVSEDTAFKPPMLLQYLALPFQTSFQGSMLAADGIRVEFTDWVTKNPNRAAIAGKLMARGLYNGQILWQRALPEGIEADEPICALADGRIYLADGAACRVLVFDMKTGAPLPHVEVDANAEARVKWLALENGRLYTLVGPKAPARKPLSFVGDKENREARAAHAAAGSAVAAIDMASGKEVWRHTEAAPIDYRTIAVRSGRLFFYSEKTRLACVGVDGKPVWENRDAAWLDAFQRPKTFRNFNVEAAPTLIVGPSGQLRLSPPGAREGWIFDAGDGRLLWKDAVAGPKAMFVGDRYVAGKGAFEAATGKQVGTGETEGGGCGIVTWVPGLGKGLGHVSMGVKSPCGVGAFAAGGTLAFSASQCDCWPHLRGAAGFIGDGGAIARASGGASHPLEPGPAGPPALKAAAGDWTQYRGGGARSGAATAAAGKSAKLRWVSPPAKTFPVPDGHDRQRLEWLERPAPPVTAGGLAFVAASDGSVRAVELAGGGTAWTYWAGGGFLTAPAFAEGRLYAGSSDGWLYCLNAKTGALAWRWRGAPINRHIVEYGKLASSWPVTAVLAEEGTVYGVAGRWMQNGSVAFALDAATGKPRWATWTPPVYDGRAFLQDSVQGFSPAGQLALVAGKLWIRTYLGLPAVFDAATGARAPASADLVAAQKAQDWTFGIRLATAGQDTILVNDRLVLGGGVPLMENQDIRSFKSAGKFVAYHVDEAGGVAALPPPGAAIPSSMIAPAIEGGEILFTGGVGRSHRSENPTIGLNLWAVDAWRAKFEAGEQGEVSDPDAADPSAGPAKRRDAKASPAVAAFGKSAVSALPPEGAKWRVEADVNALLLARDAAVAAVGASKAVTKRYGEPPVFEGWKLAAYARADGAEIWSVPLPVEPVFNGLAAAADGSYVIALRDGSLACVGP